MSKPTIRKNLSDADMLKNFEEKVTFENTFTQDEKLPKQDKRTKDAKKQEDLNTAFLTPELTERVGKALLELKLQLFKEGVVDYTIQVSRQGRQIILTPVEAKNQKHRL